MACTLSAGIDVLDCFDGVGGVNTVRIAEKKDIVSITKTGSQVTAVTMVTGKQFWEFKVDQEIANAQSVGTKNPDNGTVSYVQTINSTWRKLGVTKTNYLKLLMQNPALVAIVTDNNGNNIMYGYNMGGHITTSTSATGTKVGDKNGYDWSYTANDFDEQYFVDGSLIAALSAPAV